MQLRLGVRTATVNLNSRIGMRDVLSSVGGYCGSILAIVSATFAKFGGPSSWVRNLAIVVLLAWFSLSPLSVSADDSSDEEYIGSITEFGVTWTFAAPVRTGRFANGHHWVLAPVTITSISPAFDGNHHGWEVNPIDFSSQGFDSRARNYDAAKVLSLPYAAKGGESIVKAVSVKEHEKCRPCVKAVSVLTVLGEVPENDGEGFLRPPYFGTDKPLISVNGLRMDLLPKLRAVDHKPSPREVIRRYSMVHLDHQSWWIGRYIHPSDTMPDYGSDIANYNASSALALMIDGNDKEKKEAVIRYVNNGIDLYYMMKGGVVWPPAGGHGEGRKLPIVFASVLLDRPDLAADPLLNRSEVFAENGGVMYSETAKQVLYAQDLLPEGSYWQSIGLDKGSRTVADPYGYIDGGLRPGGSYQFCCLSKNWKATVTAIELMPELKQGFGNTELVEYVERWETTGAWAQPDPCAPMVGVCTGGGNAGKSCTSANAESVCGSTPAQCDYVKDWAKNLGVSFGPDGQGSCIKDTDPSDGIGRFPQLHGTNAGDGGHFSQFADAMWKRYIEDKTSSSDGSANGLAKGLPGTPTWKKLEP